MFYRLSPLRGRFAQAKQLAEYRGLCTVQKRGAARSANVERPGDEQVAFITKKSVNEELIQMGNENGYICQGYERVWQQQRIRQELKEKKHRTFKTSSSDVFFLTLVPIVGLMGGVFFKTQFEAARCERTDKKWFGIM